MAIVSQFPLRGGAGPGPELKLKGVPVILSLSKGGRDSTY